MDKEVKETIAMYLRNFIHYHKNRIFRASKGMLHKFPEGVEPDEDETSTEGKRNETLPSWN